MAAALELEVAKRAFALDPERDLAEAAKFGGNHVERLEIPAHRIGESAVHFHQVAHEERGLVTTSAGANFEDHRGVIGTGLAVIDQVAERVADLALSLFQSFDLGFGV